jgi:hypothetical protein
MVNNTCDYGTNLRISPGFLADEERTARRLAILPQLGTDSPLGCFRPQLQA